MRNENGRGRGVALVDVVHAQSINLDVVGLERVVLEVGETRVGRSDGLHARPLPLGCAWRRWLAGSKISTAGHRSRCGRPAQGLPTGWTLGRASTTRSDTSWAARSRPVRAPCVDAPPAGSAA